jgi:hypothetical protein
MDQPEEIHFLDLADIEIACEQQFEDHLAIEAELG